MGLLEQFRLLLKRDAPAMVVIPGQPPIAERRSRPRMNAREGTRVLIIDDSTMIVTVLKKFLRSAGYETLEALDAESALPLLQLERPELIFLDIMLPGMSGFSALRAIRRDPRARDIPVIMMSGNEQAVEQFGGGRTGADDFMKKPFSRRDLFLRIEGLLNEDLTPCRAKLRIAPQQPFQTIASA